MKEPTSMDEIIYFTRRVVGNGNVVAWVYKRMCPKCGKVLMNKPRDKRGKVLMRAKEYVCLACGYTAEKKEYEETLTCEVNYTCPDCGYEGAAEIPFKRKKIKGVDAIVFKCAGCGKDIPITKKMKEKGAEEE